MRLSTRSLVVPKSKNEADACRRCADSYACASACSLPASGYIFSSIFPIQLQPRRATTVLPVAYLLPYLRRPKKPLTPSMSKTIKKTGCTKNQAIGNSQQRQRQGDRNPDQRNAELHKSADVNADSPSDQLSKIFSRGFFRVPYPLRFPLYTDKLQSIKNLAPYAQKFKRHLLHSAVD